MKAGRSADIPRWRWDANRDGDLPCTTRVVRIRGELCARSPLSIGSGHNDLLSDHPVLRRADGRPYIPGTTLAGVLRGLAVESGVPAERVDALFGKADKDIASPSRLVVDDLDMIDVGEAAGAVETRDHVRISGTTGVAERGKKYDRDAVVAGTRFALQIEWHETEHGRSDNAATVASLLLRLVEGISLGGRTSRGLGDCALEPSQGSPVRVDSFDLARPADLLAWIDETERATECRDPASVRAAIRAQVGDGVAARAVDELHVKLTLRLNHTLIIRAPGRPGEDAKLGIKDSDAAHLRRLNAGGGETPVVTGTTLAGALRHRADGIARCLGARPAVADALVSALFGPLPRNEGKGQKKAKLYKGAARIGESTIKGGKELRHTRVVIDPWTGGALEHYLFTEDVQVGGSFALDATVGTPRAPVDGATPAPPAAAVQGLLLLALRDLWLGDLPIGGEVGVGRGVVLGEALILDRAGGTPRSIDLKADRAAASLGDEIEPLIHALREYVARSNEQGAR